MSGNKIIDVLTTYHDKRHHPYSDPSEQRPPHDFRDNEVDVDGGDRE